MSSDFGPGPAATVPLHDVLAEKVVYADEESSEGLKYALDKGYTAHENNSQYRGDSQLNEAVGSGAIMSVGAAPFNMSKPLDAALLGAAINEHIASWDEADAHTVLGWIIERFPNFYDIDLETYKTQRLGFGHATSGVSDLSQSHTQPPPVPQNPIPGGGVTMASAQQAGRRPETREELRSARMSRFGHVHSLSDLKDNEGDDCEDEGQAQYAYAVSHAAPIASPSRK
ncbi:hypothetical protein NMY22_g10542 [Coprinellus aureogranulatus]|nr:hypothetical protein NMY22_g10542 [Coprinellus aureogranulatus]